MPTDDLPVYARSSNVLCNLTMGKWLWKKLGLILLVKWKSAASTQCTLSKGLWLKAFFQLKFTAEHRLFMEIAMLKRVLYVAGPENTMKEFICVIQNQVNDLWQQSVSFTWEKLMIWFTIAGQSTQKNIAVKLWSFTGTCG